MPSSFISTATEAPSLHLSNSEQTPFCTLGSVLRRTRWRDQSSMEAPSKTSVSCSTTVRTSRNALGKLSSDFAEGHAGTNPSEDKKRVP